MLYAEFGFGNASLISTEIESGMRERRVARFLVRRVTQFYVRIWIGRVVVVAGIPLEVKVVIKNRNAFKFLVGIASTQET
jgi:hypothetical protein